ncbi:LysR substrate-binding domain-containing protein [Prodigiosinella aquatilis]|nr:LysR family transcriptional regulator [Prodigiosinella sp. LS101]WJV55485.1 LysR substrate-binding domain-containing protein [Prodigiosinella sp. LS101]WJV59846.1 LysR substrate-binding domain-containing protein [Pectobacteriaceae bacterium C111]
MDLIQLRMFCLVAETSSVVRAAEQLHRVPSNLTTRLRQLEQELGEDLFIREKQRLRLSPLGHNFLCYAQRILALSDEAIAMTHTGKPAGNFALGALESLIVTPLPTLLASFHLQYPQVNLSLESGTGDELLDSVRTGLLATALVNGPVNDDALNGCAVFVEQLVLVTSLGNPTITHASQVRNRTLFSFSRGCGYRRRLEAWFRSQGIAHGNVVEVSSYSSMLACVAGGAGLAIVPRSVLGTLPVGNQVLPHELPVEMAEATTWLVWRREAFGPNVEALKKLIIEQFPH